jgi:hypothetical protein
MLVNEISLLLHAFGHPWHIVDYSGGLYNAVTVYYQL